MAASQSPPEQRTVAVVGPTGKLGRACVKLLCESGVRTRVLCRHDANPSTVPGAGAGATASEVTAWLAAQPGVELVRGDVTDMASVAALLKGCDACLARSCPMGLAAPDGACRVTNLVRVVWHCVRRFTAPAAAAGCPIYCLGPTQRATPGTAAMSTMRV